MAQARAFAGLETGVAEVLQLGPGRQPDSSGVKESEAGPGRGEDAGRDQAEGGPERGVGRSSVVETGVAEVPRLGPGLKLDSSGWGGFNYRGRPGPGGNLGLEQDRRGRGGEITRGGGAGLSGRDRSGSANSSVLNLSTITSPSAWAPCPSPPPCVLHLPPRRGAGRGPLGPFPIRFTAGQVNQATGGILPGRFPTDVPEVLQVA